MFQIAINSESQEPDMWNWLQRHIADIVHVVHRSVFLTKQLQTWMSMQNIDNFRHNYNCIILHYLIILFILYVIYYYKI